MFYLLVCLIHAEGLSCVPGILFSMVRTHTKQDPHFLHCLGVSDSYLSRISSPPTSSGDKKKKIKAMKGVPLTWSTCKNREESSWMLFQTHTKTSRHRSCPQLPSCIRTHIKTLRTERGEGKQRLRDTVLELNGSSLGRGGGALKDEVSIAFRCLWTLGMYFKINYKMNFFKMEKYIHFLALPTADWLGVLEAVQWLDRHLLFILCHNWDVAWEQKVRKTASGKPSF